MGRQPATSQTAVLLEHRAHDVGGTDDTLHQKIGPALGAEGNGNCGAVGIFLGGDHFVLAGILARLYQQGGHFINVAHQNRRDQLCLACGHHRLDHGVIMSSSNGKDAPAILSGSFKNAVNGRDHGSTSCRFYSCVYYTDFSHERQCRNSILLSFVLMMDPDI